MKLIAGLPRLYFQVLDQMSTLINLFQASKDHFCSRNILLRVEQIFE